MVALYAIWGECDRLTSPETATLARAAARFDVRRSTSVSGGALGLPGCSSCSAAIISVYAFALGDGEGETVHFSCP